MRRNMKYKFKFHRKYKRISTYGCTLCLTLIMVLTGSMCLGTKMTAFAKGGIVTGSSTDNDTFWHGYASPTDLRLSQTVTVKEAGKELDVTYTDTDNAATVTVSLPFAREGSFAPTITTQLRNSHPYLGEFDDEGNVKPETLWYDYVNQPWYFSFVSYYSRGAMTYYRVVSEENSRENMGKILLQYYKDNYQTSNRKSADMMLTYNSASGTVFIPVAEACANANGWLKYDGTEIPLWQNGEAVKKIEMITVNPAEYYCGVARGNRTDSRTIDMDIMLYTTHTYHFNYTEEAQILKAPNVSTESGKAFANGISEDDYVVLSNEQSAKNARSEYFLSDAVVTDLSRIKWTEYTESFSPGGKKYLYVRSNYADGKQKYIESQPVEYEITYLEASSAIVKAEPENGTAVDVGDEIELYQYGAAEGSSLFYVIDADVVPELTRISYKERQTLLLDNKAGNSDYIELNHKVYIKVNGLWYESSDSSLQRYSAPIVTDEQLQIRNTIGIYVLVGDEGKELGTFQPLRYTYGVVRKTVAPESTLATSPTTPTGVKMGDVIGLMCSTVGSRIFYTTNGSAPNIQITPDGPVAGANTREYSDSEPIVISEDIADYGKTFLIMAQAVTYVEIEGNYYRTYQDSPVVKFVYKVGSQTPVEKVLSIPQTNADEPTVLQVGSRIQLYSQTEGVDIFYTLNGTEPTFDTATKEPGTNTYRYSGAEGIIIGKSENSSLFTITAVAYKEGLAVSEISRMVYAYPGAVTSPYATPIAGVVAENTEVTLKTATEGAVIYYEIAYGEDVPGDPTPSSKVFDASSPIVISKKATVKAYAVKDSMESTISTFSYTVSNKLNTPTSSIGTGAVVPSGTTISLTADNDATIHYTLDGSDPKDASNKKVQVGNSVILSGDVGSLIVLRAYASKSGFSSSDVCTYNYNISTYAGGIFADKASGDTVKTGEVIHLYTDMSDAKIYYTVDGTAPTEKSASGNAVIINGEPGAQVTIMAMAVASGSTKTTSFATFTYTIVDKLAAPTASVPNHAVFTEEGKVELNAENGQIYYTTDGSIPSMSSNLYKKGIIIDRAITIKAIAVHDDYQQSEVSTFSYDFAKQVAAPTATYASGELEMGTKITFMTETEGATIYYRTDGAEPDTDNKDGLEIYTGPITVNKATNFKVIAVKNNMRDSQLLNVGYTVREPIVLETEVVEEWVEESVSGRLQSRRNFSSSESGPTYTDVILRNATYGVVISGEETAFPENILLKVEPVHVNDSIERTVKSNLGDSYGILESYHVELLVDDEVTQPLEEIEIGIPISSEYENSVIQLVKVQEDGYVETCNARRTNGVAYVMTKELGDYSVVAPLEYKEEKEGISKKVYIYIGAVVFFVLGCLLRYIERKKKKEGEA